MSEFPEELRDIAALFTLKVKPADLVVIESSRLLTTDQLACVEAYLRERAPELRFAVLEKGFEVKGVLAQDVRGPTE